MLKLHSLHTLLFVHLCNKIFVTFVALVMISTPHLANAIDCEKRTPGKAIPGDLGYKARGNFCEGLYESNVSAGFELVSLIEKPLEPYKSGDIIYVVAPNISKQIKDSSIIVSGVALRPRFFYRMDAEIRSEETLQWPTKVLSEIELHNSELGIFGQSNRNQNTLDPIYIPIQAILKKNVGIPPPSTGAEIIVRAGTNIERLAWRFLGPKASDEDKYTTRKKSYPASDPIRIELIWPQPTPEFIKLDLIAKPIDSDIWLTRILNIATPSSPNVMKNDSSVLKKSHVEIN